MADILHRIIVEAAPEKVYRALTEQTGLSGWWTQAKTNGGVGSNVNFAFGPNGEHQVDMQVLELVENKKVVWKCVRGPWVETGEFEFEIKPHERGSEMLFSHSGWQEADEFYRHCNSKWGFFFTVSLKDYLETGTGKPGPQDPDI